MAAASKEVQPFWNIAAEISHAPITSSHVDLNFDLSTLSALKTFYYYKKEKAYKVF